MTDLTSKSIEFLSNQELVSILRSALNEIEVVASYGAHRSTTYLAVSAIEGIFREILSLKKLQPSGGTVPTGWPIINRTGNPKAFDKLTLQDMGQILKANGGLPADFEELYDIVRQYRNYMHPKVELDHLKPINRSVAQLSLACLNALIERYAPLRFLAGEEWSLEYGVAEVLADSLVHMPQDSIENVSLLVTKRRAVDFREIKFRVRIPPDAIFNFVYNYLSLDHFMAARIEGRVRSDGRGSDNGRLHCTKWRYWPVNGRCTRESEPDPNLREHNVHVVLDPLGIFTLNVDGNLLELDAGASWGFDSNGHFGFMTESGVVSVVDIEVLLW